VLPLVGVPPFVNTGVFNVDHVNLYNCEAAVSFGRAVLQSEYRWSNVVLPTGEDATVHGGYVAARYMLTGEVIPYNRKAGVFSRPKPLCPLDISQGQIGAWELAARFSTLDLNPLFGAAGVPGPTGRLNSTSLALSWYWFANAKVQVEWVNGSLDRPEGDSVTNTFASRVQFDF
jgi:phosphate-selective porin OprO/OprP